jgi:hypothetical protein
MPTITGPNGAAGDNSRAPDRLSRHYYDLALLSASSIGEKALADLTLLERVAVHKKTFFRSGWARYDEARPGSLRLVPPDGRLETLRRDYDSMQLMFFGDIVPFDQILEALTLLERRINGTT